MKKIIATAGLAIAVVAVTLFYVHSSRTAHLHQSPYAGQQDRPIKNLSPDDVRDIDAGNGWGLAKAAELNGMPGPRHVLDAASDLDLSATQEGEISKIYDAMKASAIAAGKTFLAQEQALEEAFRSGDIKPDALREKLQSIAQARAELRVTHLVAHVDTTRVLNETQIAKYNEIRGYGTGDPCDNVPAGHNAAMWRRHNNCS